MKTKEACNSKDNLCANCHNNYPSCVSRIRFGNGVGFHNIRGCTEFSEVYENNIPFIEVDMSQEDFEATYED